MKSTILVLILLLFSVSGIAQPSHKWKTLNTGTTKNINAMYFVNSEVGYIVGEDYLFKKTTDGGLTWFDLTAPTKGEMPNNKGNIIAIDFHTSFSFSNQDSGLYLTWEKGYHGVVTNDDGNSYSNFNYIDTALFCSINGFKILPENKGNGYVNMYTFGQNCNGKPTFYNFYDGPFSFAHSDSVETATPASFTTVDRDSLTSIFGTSNGYLWRYPWVTSKPDSILLDTFGVTSIAYARYNTWYAATNAGLNNMYISTDSGKSFTRDTTFPQTFHYPTLNEMSFLSPQNGVIAGTSNGQNGVIIMKDSTQWFFLTAQSPLKAAKLFDNGVGYVAGENGLVMKTGEGNPVNGLEEINKSDIIVYPNPASNWVTIKGLGNLNVQSISLLDISGRVVRHYQNNCSELNVSGLSLGIYQIQISTEFKEFSRKIMIH